MIRSGVLAVVAALLLSGCSRDAATPAEAPKADSRLALQFQASTGLNPSGDGHAAPVRVRLFELKSSAGFLRADYFTLAERAQATLGGDLVAQDELLIRPGERREVLRALDPATRQLGLMVGYRDIDRAQWRSVIELPPGGGGHYRIELDDKAVRSVASDAPTR